MFTAVVITQKETCDHAQRACLVCGKYVGGESNPNPNMDQQTNEEILAHGVLSFSVVALL